MRDDQPIWAKREDSRTLRTAARENGHRREKKKKNYSLSFSLNSRLATQEASSDGPTL